MAIATTSITGVIALPDGTIPSKSSVTFTMTGFDTDAVADATIAPRSVTSVLSDAGALDVDLWSNEDGERTTFYNVRLNIYNGNNPKVFDVGKIEVPTTGGPYDLNDLLPIAPPSGATVDEYIAQLSASVASAEAAADTAVAAATPAAELIANVRVTRDAFSELASVTASDLDVGDYARVMAVGAVYQRASDLATDEDLDYSGAGGVKWYISGSATSASNVGATNTADPDGREAFAPALVSSVTRRRMYGVSLRDLLGASYNPANDASVALNGFTEELAPEGIGIYDDLNLEVSAEDAIIARPDMKMLLSPNTRIIKRSSGATRLLSRDKSKDSRDTLATANATAGGFLVVTAPNITAVVGDRVLIRHLSDSRWLGGRHGVVTSISGDDYTLDLVCVEAVSAVSCHATVFIWSDNFHLSGGVWGAFDDNTKGGHCFELLGSEMNITDLSIDGHYSDGSGGLAMLLFGDHNRITRAKTYTPPTAAGVGGIRIAGGSDWLVCGSNVVSGDDALQFVPNTNPSLIEYDWDIVDSAYIGGYGYSYSARAIIAAMGGPQNDDSMLCRLQGLTFRGIRGSGVNASMNIENTEGVCYDNQVDRILIDDVHLDGSREDALTSQSVHINGRDGGIGLVTIRDSSFLNTPRDYGIDQGSEGSHLVLDNVVASGNTHAVSIDIPARLDIIGGRYSSTTSHTVSAQVASVGAEINISQRPEFLDIATSRAAIRHSGSGSVRGDTMNAVRASGATSVSGISTSATSYADMGVITGDVDTQVGGGGYLRRNGVGYVSSTSLADATHPVNLIDKFTNAFIFETTNNRTYRATGGSATDAWESTDGTADVTPS